MSTSPSSPSSKSPTSPRVVKRKLSVAELSKPNESWFLILVNAFKSNFEQTLTYRESELYAWIMQAYPYYRHDMHTMQTSVKKTLSSYECFRQNGRSTWTFIPTRALIHLKNLKTEDGRDQSEDSLEENENENDDENEDMDQDEPVHDQRVAEDGSRSVYTHQHPFNHPDHPTHGADHHSDGPTDTSIRYIDLKADLMDEDTPTLSVEEIQRFKQEHSGAHARKAKRKASGGHSYRPRTKSPAAGLQDECSMSMEAWCNLLVQMFEATPKQKTIREIYAWVHDNYPIYQNAPGDAWQADLTAALESNPLFRAMGRGRWQMATQPSPVPMNGSMAASGNGSTTNPSIKSDDDATDSPSVTEDEDWKAIGSKRLLNFSFRRYSIATDTFPKNHYKVGSTMPAGSSPQPVATASSPSAPLATASGSTSLTASNTSGGKLLPIDPRSAGYSTARRFSSYHQPTPKNSPPLSATTFGLPSVEEFSSQLKTALSEETDDEGEEDPARRYMAPLQSAINSAVLALQTQQSQQQRSQEPETPSPAASSQPHPYSHPHTNPHPHPHSPLLKQETLPPSIVVQDVVWSVDGSSSSRIAFDGNSSAARLNQPRPIAVPSTSSSPPEPYPISTPLHTQAVSTATPEGKPEPEIVIPSGEDLASDQMDAIQALALLCGGGV